MWLSFGSNILILLVGVLLFFFFGVGKAQRAWSLFVLLTGLAAGVAAFGHLELVPIKTQGTLLFVSRLLNVLSVFYFLNGIKHNFKYHKHNYISTFNGILFLIIMSWLVYLNIKMPGSREAFKPVMTYAIVGLLILGLPNFIYHIKNDRMAMTSIITGILVMGLSALIFKVLPEGEGVKPSDISHLLIAISLITMTMGFKKLKINE